MLNTEPTDILLGSKCRKTKIVSGTMAQKCLIQNCNPCYYFGKRLLCSKADVFDYEATQLGTVTNTDACNDDNNC
jgi:hypothetical protein